jgi:hypothetical protein
MLVPIAGLVIVAGLASSLFILKAESSREINSQAVLPQQEPKLTNIEAAEQKKEAEEAAEKEALAKKEILQKPIVVFEPSGVFSDEAKQEITEKLIDPMVDYQPNIFAAIHIEVYSQDKFVGGAGDDKYIVTTIGRSDSGGNGGFLYGSKKKGLDYWVPECLDTCEFSEEYSQKHPEVVEKYQGR